jgi:hypothetical protein
VEESQNKDYIVDSTGIDRTDRELGFSNSISDDVSDFTNDFTNFTDPTVESIGRTDCAKLTNVWKHYMSDCKGLQYTTFLQLSELLATQPTSNS